MIDMGLQFAICPKCGSLPLQSGPCLICGYGKEKKIERRVKMKKPNLRKFFKLKVSNKGSMKNFWKGTKIDPLKILKGDVFRIDEPSGKPVKFKGCQYYIAHKNAKKISAKKGYVSIACFELRDAQLENAMF